MTTDMSRLRAYIFTHVSLEHTAQTDHHSERSASHLHVPADVVEELVEHVHGASRASSSSAAISALGRRAGCDSSASYAASPCESRGPHCNDHLLWGRNCGCRHPDVPRQSFRLRAAQATCFKLYFSRWSLAEAYVATRCLHSLHSSLRPRPCSWKGQSVALHAHFTRTTPPASLHSERSRFAGTADIREDGLGLSLGFRRFRVQASGLGFRGKGNQ